MGALHIDMAKLGEQIDTRVALCDRSADVGLCGAARTNSFLGV